MAFAFFESQGTASAFIQQFCKHYWYCWIVVKWGYFRRAYNAWRLQNLSEWPSSCTWWRYLCLFIGKYSLSTVTGPGKSAIWAYLALAPSQALFGDCCLSCLKSPWSLSSRLLQTWWLFNRHCWHSLVILIIFICVILHPITCQPEGLPALTSLWPIVMVHVRSHTY